MFTHDTKNEEYGNFFERGVQENDSDNSGFDEDISRHRSKLKVLYHASSCPCEKLSCCPSGVVHCCASKRLFAHLTTCTSGDDCDVPGCEHSKRVWNHYQKCRRSVTKNCVICSAVPTHYDMLILCDRFRTETSLCKPAAKISDRSRSIQSHGSQEKYDSLPVWRKRNMLHARQQQHQQIPRHEKENTTSLTKFATSKNVLKQYRGVGQVRAALHDSDGSLNQSASQKSALSVDRKAHHANMNGIPARKGGRFSATTQYTFDESNKMADDLSNVSSPRFRLPVQLPVHPRDAKRKSQSALQATNRRCL